MRVIYYILMIILQYCLTLQRANLANSMTLHATQKLICRLGGVTCWGYHWPGEGGLHVRGEGDIIWEG